jgi:hypothetical protein
MADGAFFPYEIDRRWRPMFALLGVSSDDGVSIEDGMLRAPYGRVSVHTPVSNIDHTDVSGPHRWYTAVGLRLSAADDGITFGTNHQRGLCIAFVEPVKRIIGFKNHSALWVSVADPDGLAAAIQEAASA